MSILQYPRSYLYPHTDVRVATNALEQNAYFSYNEAIDPVSILTAECFHQDPTAAWKWLRLALKALDTLGRTEGWPHLKAILSVHEDLQRVQSRLRFVTASLDGAFEASVRACGLQRLLVDEGVATGSRRVLNMRGSIQRTRCSSKGCETGLGVGESWVDMALASASAAASAPRCGKCGAFLRPDCVLLDELIESQDEAMIPAVKEAIREADCVVLVGSHWQEEEELSNGIFTHIMDNKPVFEFAEQSLLRAGRVKFVSGNPMITVPLFAKALHNLLMATKSTPRLHCEQLRTVKALKPLAQCVITLPQCYSRRESLRRTHFTHKATELGKPLNLFKAAALNDRFAQDFGTTSVVPSFSQPRNKLPRRLVRLPEATIHRQRIDARAMTILRILHRQPHAPAQPSRPFGKF